MSVKVEWSGAKTLGPELLGPGEAAPDGQHGEEHVLLLGGEGGACLAVEGTLAEIEDGLQHALAVVRGEA